MKIHPKNTCIYCGNTNNILYDPSEGVHKCVVSKNDSSVNMKCLLTILDRA